MGPCTLLYSLWRQPFAAAGVYSDSPGPDAILDDHTTSRRAVTAVIPILLIAMVMHPLCTGVGCARAVGAP